LETNGAKIQTDVENISATYTRMYQSIIMCGWFPQTYFYIYSMPFAFVLNSYMLLAKPEVHFQYKLVKVGLEFLMDIDVEKS
jgi:hypothetical protein